METYNFATTIEQLGGNQDAVKFVMESDMRNLAQRAIYVQQRRASFPSYVVTPVMDIAVGLKEGQYLSINESILNRKDEFQSQSPVTALPPKKLYLACFLENEYCTKMPKAFQREKADLLKEYRLKCVEHPLQYLLGLMMLDIDYAVTKNCNSFKLKDTDKSGTNHITAIQQNELDELVYVGLEIGFNESNQHRTKIIAHYQQAWFCSRDKFHLLEDIE